MTTTSSADLVVQAYREQRMSQRAVTIGEVIKIGAELKGELELAACEQNADAAWLAKRILREWLAARARVDNIPRYHRGTHEAGIPDLSVTPDPRNHAESALAKAVRCAWQESNTPANRPFSALRWHGGWHRASTK